ncbi:MAG: ABC transporter substrate-binding protein [Pseudonocardiaceae bacterium]
MLATNADLNLSNPGVTTAAKAEDLKAAGIPTLYPAGECVYLEHPDPGQAEVTFDDIYASIEQLGELFDAQPTAKDAVATLCDRVAAVESKIAASGETAMQVQIFNGVIYSVSGIAAIEQTQLEALGLENPAAGTGDELNAEALIGFDPYVIILQYGFDTDDGIKILDKAKQEFLALPGVSTMTAVKNDAIVGVNVFLTYPDTLAVEGIEEIARQLEKR